MIRNILNTMRRQSLLWCWQQHNISAILSKLYRTTYKTTAVQSYPSYKYNFGTNVGNSLDLSIFKTRFSKFQQLIWTRSSWFNCVLRDDEALCWVSIGHYEALAVGNWWYWVRRGHLCLYILHKVEIWKGVTHTWQTDWLTTLKDRATQLLIKRKSV